MTRDPVKTRKNPMTAGRARRQRSKPKTARTTSPAQAELAVADTPRDTVSGPSLPPVEAEAGGDETFESAPERAFAARVPPPEPARPFPASRRAVFFDVENSSRPEHVSRMIDHLAIDRLGRTTEIVAVGNWKVIGHDTARLLARHGAHLVHSAPSSGIRDWSDLRIAVSAGIWVAAARPGDILEIVSDDRAFDAVGDVAASLGIAFRRLSYRELAGIAGEVGEAVEPPIRERRSRRRRGGRRGRGATTPARHHPVVAPPAAPAADRAEPSAEPHTAPHDEIVAVVRDLLDTSSGGVVSIDALANALKRKGFRRTPGSPRLITRLRRIKEVAVSQSGMITLVGSPGSAGAGTPAGTRDAEAPNVLLAAPDTETAAPAEHPDEPGEPALVSAAAPRRRSRRGRRRRRSRGHATLVV
jgi:hypothetical protein